jgi:hypothetical protein
MPSKYPMKHRIFGGLMKTVANWVLAAALLFPLASFVNAPSAHADQAPDCLANNGSVIPVINNQVAQWEQTTPNQYLARAHVAGPIVQIYPDQNGHHHFAIQITQDARLEVVYNEDFGATPAVSVGMNVDACGDYITSTAQSGSFPPSPDNAIIHWVHESPNLNKHQNGYLMIDGVLYGQGPANEGPQY